MKPFARDITNLTDRQRERLAQLGKGPCYLRDEMPCTPARSRAWWQTMESLARLGLARRYYSRAHGASTRGPGFAITTAGRDELKWDT